MLELVIGQGLSVYKASQLVGIKNVTAKVIVRKYRREGVIFKRKSEESDDQSESLVEKSVKG